MMALVMAISSAQPVQANNKLNVTINKELTAVSPAQVMVDGELIPLEVPAFLRNSRIVVPVRFVAEQVGAEVKWDDVEKRVIITTLQKEIQLWINKANMKINGQDISLDEGSIPRLVKFANGDSRTMIPLRAIGEALGYEVGFDQATLTGKLTKQKVEAPNAEPNSSGNAGYISGKTIEKAEVMVYNGKVVLHLAGIDKKKINISKLENPNRVIFDIEDAVFAQGKWEFLPISYDNIQKIRIAQFQGKEDEKTPITRVVFDVAKLSSIDELLYFFADNSLQIDIRSIETMSGQSVVDATLEDKKNNPDKDSADKIKDKSKNEMEIGYDWQAQVSKRLNSAILLPLADYAEENKYVHILIDPGHGGRDPGTISFNQRNEKDFALAASLMLRDDLRKMGFTVFMTRETDVYPTLIERANMANTLKVDIFISMHANSVDPNRGPNGIEVWYSGVPKSGSYQSLEKQLARKVDKKLIEVTSAVDRGIKVAKHVVTYKSKMAAILVEAGFLSNPVEESLLFTDSYRAVVARAVAVAVNEFVTDSRTVLASSKKSMIADQPVLPSVPSTTGNKVKYRVNADVLRVRDNPGLSTNTIGRVYENEILTVEYGVEEIKKDGYTWLYVTNISGHLSGWLAKEFLIEEK